MATIYPRDTFVMNGGLMSYGSALGEPIKRVALMVDKILKGTKTADIPVEQAKQFTLVSEPQNSQTNRPHNSS